MAQEKHLASIFRKNMIDLETQIGFRQRKNPLFRQLSFFLQFTFIFVFKVSLFPIQYNASLHYISHIALQFIVNRIFLILFNLTIITPFILFTIWNIFQIKQEGSHKDSENILLSKNMKNLIVKAILLLEFTRIPCLCTGVRWFYLVVTDPLYKPELQVLILTVIAFTITFITIIRDSYSMLLKNVTIPVILCCLGPNWNHITLKVTALIFIMSQISYKQLIASSNNNPFAQSYRLLLIFVFVLDALTPSISNAFFLLYITVIALIPFALPKQEFIENNIEINKFILEILNNWKKRQIIGKQLKFKVIREVIKHQKTKDDTFPIKKQMREFKLSHPLTYLSLRQFFKIKISQDMQNYKNENIYILQYYLFEVKHNSMSLLILEQIAEFSHNNDTKMTIEQRVILLEIKHEINEIFKLRQNHFNLTRMINLCTQIQATNNYLQQATDIMINFWTNITIASLSEQQIISTMNRVEEKEERVKLAVQNMKQFPSLINQSKMCNFALKLFDFSYDPQNNFQQKRQFCLMSTYFVILSQMKVKDISNQMLLELHKKKSEILNTSLEVLIPCELLNFIQKKFGQSFKSKDTEKIILPFLTIKNKMCSFLVELDMNYSLESGIQQNIHFFNNDIIQQLPLFLYFPSSDRILYTNQIFDQYLRQQQHHLHGDDILGYDFFGPQLEIVFENNNKKKKNDSMYINFLKRRQEKELKQVVQLKIMEIYQTQIGDLILLAIQKYENIHNLIKINTFSMKNFVKIKKQQETNTLLKTISDKNNDDKKLIVCPIPNSYQIHIDQSMTNIKVSQCRSSYLLKICLLMCLLILCSITIVSYMYMSVNQIGKKTQKTFDLSVIRGNTLDNNYELLFLAYRYYHISTYPLHYLNIRNYNMTELKSKLQRKINDYILKIMSTDMRKTPTISQQYTIIEQNFIRTEFTSSLSFIDFIADIKQGLNSLNFSFSVRNEATIDTIMKAYHKIQIDYLEDSFNKFNNIIIIIVCIQAIIVIVIKFMTYKLEQITQQVMKLFETIPKKDIENHIQKIKQLKKVLNFDFSNTNKSNKVSNKTKQTSQTLESQYNKQSQQTSLNQFCQQSKPKVIRKSFWNFLMYNNLIVVYCLVQILLIPYTQLLTNNYEKNIKMAYTKQLNFQDKHLNIIKPAEEFYQQAMEQTLPASQRPNKIPFLIQHLLSDSANNHLPSYFKDYQLLQTSALALNLCSSVSLIKEQLYQKINCSNILDGIMEKSFPDVYAQYKSLIRNYSGVGISKLGDTYRAGAVYPVFLEICFIRRYLQTTIEKLQIEFYKKIPGFIQQENNSILMIALLRIVAISFCVVYIFLDYRRMKTQVKTTIRAFKAIPKQYLLKRKISKYIKNEDILKKIQKL